jgi:hypothetical protein
MPPHALGLLTPFGGTDGTMQRSILVKLQDCLVFPSCMPTCEYCSVGMNNLFSALLRPIAEGEVSGDETTKVFGLVACGWLSWAGTVHADAVTDWNQHTATVIISPVPTGAGKPATLGLEVPLTVVVLRASRPTFG